MSVKHVLLRLLTEKGAVAYLSTSYVGKIVSWDKKAGIVTIEKACLIYEEVNYLLDEKSRQPIGTKIDMKYLTNSFITNGQISLRESDCLFVREVEAGDECLIGYDDAVNAFRLEKLNIEKANAVPPQPAMNARRVQPSRQV